jgi:hypothetical protein
MYIYYIFIYIFIIYLYIYIQHMRHVEFCDIPVAQVVSVYEYIEYAGMSAYHSDVNIR